MNIPYDLYKKALDSGQRLTREEELILITDKGIALAYTQDVLNGKRFFAAERLYYDDPEFVLAYTKHILKGKRFETAEPFLKENLRHWRLYKAYTHKDYFYYQLNDQWIEGINSTNPNECRFILKNDDNELDVFLLEELNEEQKRKIIQAKEYIQKFSSLKNLF